MKSLYESILNVDAAATTQHVAQNQQINQVVHDIIFREFGDLLEFAKNHRSMFQVGESRWFEYRHMSFMWDIKTLPLSRLTEIYKVFDKEFKKLGCRIVKGSGSRIYREYWFEDCGYEKYDVKHACPYPYIRIGKFESRENRRLYVNPNFQATENFLEGL